MRVQDELVIALKASRGERTAEERARAANAVIQSVLAQKDGEVGPARYEEAQGTAVVYVGTTPVMTLGPEDVEAEHEESLALLAAEVTSRLGRAISTERQRTAIATTVFSISLVVFSALLAFLLLNRVTETVARLRTWLTENSENVNGVHLGSIEVLSAASARGAASAALSIGHRGVQFAVAYGWLIFALSLFDATRGYTERLTGMVLKPLYGFVSRLSGALPLVLVVGIAALAVAILVRFIGLFFESIARGETRVPWMPRDLAKPTSVLARAGVVVVSLVLASPIITGEGDGVLTRAGLVALGSIALASTPLLASTVVGALVVYGRRVRRGDRVEIGAHRGRVLDVTLFDVRLEDESLSDTTVPHLYSLVNPTRVLRHAPLVTVDVVVSSEAPQGAVEKALLDAARSVSSRARVELVSLDTVGAAGARWRVTSAPTRNDVSLAKMLQEAIASFDPARRDAAASGEAIEEPSDESARRGEV